MKSYLRFEPRKTVGVVASPRCNITYDFSGNLAVTGAVQDVSVWNLRQSIQVGNLKAEQPKYPYSVNSEVLVVERSPDKVHMAAGYHSGEIVLFNYIRNSITCTLRGHRSAVTCLAFEGVVASKGPPSSLSSSSLLLLNGTGEQDGGGALGGSMRGRGRSSGSGISTLMASGSADCEIIVWDLIASRGVCKLRGHKDGVTGVAFVPNASEMFTETDDNGYESGRFVGTLLVSVSKDTMLKVWDIDTRECIQTVVGHRCEIWSVAVLLSSEPQQQQQQKASSAENAEGAATTSRGNCWNRISVWTGSADELIRGYKFVAGSSGAGSGSDEIRGSSLLLGGISLEYYGSVVRGTGAGDRCAGLQVNPQGSLLAVQTVGKMVEIYRIRNAAEAKKKLKRRMKRAFAASSSSSMEKDPEQLEELEQQQNGSSSSSSCGAAAAPVAVLQLSDEIELLHTIRCPAKVRGFAFSPQLNTNSHSSSSASTRRIGGGDGGTSSRAMVSLLSNTLELYDIPDTAPISSEDGAALEGGGAGTVSGAGPKKVSVIDLHGHRSDIRAVAAAGDGSVIATCSYESVKVWNSRSMSCTSTCLMEGQCVSLAFAPGARYVIVGDKEGFIQIVDTAAGEVIWGRSAPPASSSSLSDDKQQQQQQQPQHAKGSTVWALSVRPDGKGFMSGGSDCLVKFWDFEVSERGLRAEQTRELQMSHDVLSLSYSPNKAANRLLVSAALLDNTIKVFYDDSLKFVHSLYGHKLPVMCLDISYDSTLLVSGSADKTVKIWGMDFGDCHRSLIAHEDSVTCVRFQPKTHYFFSGGKDGALKYWDADRFEQVLYLPGHMGAVWGLTMCANLGNLYSASDDEEFGGQQVQCFSVGQDRSIRLWQRTDDLVFVEEEKERAMEAQIEKEAASQNRIADDSLGLGAGGADGVPAAAGFFGESSGGISASGMAGEIADKVGSKNSESVKGGEALMDALDLVEGEIAELQEREEQELVAAKQQRFAKGKKAAAGMDVAAANAGGSVGDNKRRTPPANPRLLNLSPYRYMIRALRQVKAPDLEEALLLLPFSYVTRMIAMLVQLSKRGLDIELCTRCALFLIRCHQGQVMNSQPLLPEMLQLRNIILNSVGSYRDLVGTNVVALRFMSRVLKERKEDGMAASREGGEGIGYFGLSNSGSGPTKRTSVEEGALSSVFRKRSSSSSSSSGVKKRKAGEGKTARKSKH